MVRFKAISPVVATILLILIAVAASIFIYQFIITWTGETTAVKEPEGALVVELASFENDTADQDTTIGELFVFWVRNDGRAPVYIDRVYVTLPDGTVVYVNATNGLDVADNPINVGEVDKVVVNATKAGIDVEQDTVYTFKIVAKDGSFVTVSVRT
jgi:flagellin-like protein